MGNNMNLVEFLGLPEKDQCPHCNQVHDTGFTDFDIETPDEIFNNGRLSLSVYCPNAEATYRFETTITFPFINRRKV